MKTNNNVPYLIILLIGCSVFAGFNYYNKIISPFSKDVLKCEGIVLNEALNYHLTDKNSHDALRNIREQEVEINDSDILLHYRTQDMEKITPSYWGMFFYNEAHNEWNFKLDKSFSNNPNSHQNIHLPFMRKLYDDEFFFDSSTTVSEAQLKEKLFVNTIGGTKGSRYYIEIKTANDKKILPFYDEGIKRSYSLKNVASKVLITFNRSEDVSPEDYLYSYQFENSTSLNGAFELIYHPNKSLQLRNLDSGNIYDINGPYFEVGDMMFSVLPRYSTPETYLLLFYVFITFFSAVMMLFLMTGQDLLCRYILSLRFMVLMFLLLGFPTLAMAFDTQNFSFLRKLILAIGVPSVPYISFLLYSKLKNSKYLSHVIGKVYTVGAKILEHKIGLVLLLALSLAFLLTTRNERVLGVLPVLHYIKIILFALFLMLYSNALWLKRMVVKVPSQYHTYFKSVILIGFSFVCSILTKDYGSLALVIFASLLFEYSLGNLPLTIGEKRLSFPVIIGIYLCFVFAVFCLGFLIDMPDKAYRLTYTFNNPDSLAYENVTDANRETISVLYQNLKLLLEYPLGIKNLVIPRAALSVSHSDYALHWAVMNNGMLFLGLLVAVLLAFATTVFRLIFVFSREIISTKQGITSASKRLTMFTAFILIFTLLQCLVPLASNLLLPGAFLTGIPFPGISISIGDAIFFTVLFFLLDSLSGQKSNLPESIMQSFSTNAKRFGTKATKYIAALYLILLTFKFLHTKFLQSSSTSFKTSKELVDRIVDLPSTANIEVFLDYAFRYFEGKNLSRLSTKDKLIARMIACRYYSSSNTKLNRNRSRFYVSSRTLRKKIVLDSLLSSSKLQISGDQWPGDAVYIKSHFVNGSERYTPTSKYYSNMDFTNIHLNKDITAIVNKEIEAHFRRKLRNYNNLDASILVVENTTGHTIVNSAYPFDSKNPDREKSFFPGSVKKILLAHFYSLRDSRGIESEIFETRSAPTPLKWIAKSNNSATYEYWENINVEDYKSYLEEWHGGFSYSSNAIRNGYSETSEKAERITVIGGKIKYTPKQINNWLRSCSKDSFENGNTTLSRLLNAPLIHRRGTARQVAFALEENGFDVTNYIAKTGTLEKRGRNIATAFAISNKSYTITVLIDGVQPPNRNEASAKHLFMKIIPILSEYL